MIGKDALGEWLANPITKMYFAGIREKIKDLSLDMGNGGTLDSENSHTTIVQTAKRVGRIEGLQDRLEIDQETVLEGDE